MATCPACGKELLGEFPFCPHCGAAVAPATPAPAAEERKVVSVLFCDLVDFTSSSDRADPEDVRARIRPYHARLRTEIERYQGTVEKFIGDAVMAAFGAPVAHEDDAERAVRAGLRIVEAIDDMNAGDASLGLAVRVGINTGEAVVALTARPERGEGMVTGDVVNTAARLQMAAPVNGVVVGEQTYRITRDKFDYEPMEPVVVKGKAEAVPLWRAVAARARYGTDVPRTSATPFVGRQLEKAVLIGVLERAVQQRSVHLVTIVGEPGVGKSRLVVELFAYEDAQPRLVRWRQGRCLPYGEGITFWALGEIVKAEAGILESDSPEVAAAKLDIAVPADVREREWLKQRLAPLVGAEVGAAAERQELFIAWRSFLEAIAADRPTVLVVEDLHWADEALLAFIEHVAEWSEGVPLLLICTARPELLERRPSWGAGLRNSNTIDLAPLSEAETAQLVAALLPQTVLSAEVKRALLEHAGGNPLYAEEFVRLLNDRGIGAGVAAFALPENVQALIAARLDTLAPARKSLLQDAAVVGKVFWAGAVAAMGGRDMGEVEKALHELSRKELVRPARTSTIAREAEYAFWHLLVRDVAYAEIPRGERARRHRAAAAWIEDKAGERLSDLAEVLAYHTIAALELARATGDTAQADELAAPARRFLALAGERELGLDTLQAEARLAKALELCPYDHPERPGLLASWANAAFQAGRVREAADALDAALATYRTRGDMQAAGSALQLRSRIARYLGEGVELAAEAVAVLETEQPGPALVAAYEELAAAQFVAGAYEGAIAATASALAVAERLRLPEPARALAYRGVSRAYLGDSEGLSEAERALGVLVARGAGADAAVAQNNLILARYPLDGPARSLAALEEGVAGIAFAERRGLAGSVVHLEGNAPGLLAELGRTEEALDRASSSAPALEASGSSELSEVHAVELALRLARGEPVERLIRPDLLVEAGNWGMVDERIITLGAAALAQLVIGAPETARACLDQVARTEGARATSYYARQLPAMVRTALAAGDPALAERLVEGLQPNYPLREHAICAANAALAEAAGYHARAAMLYAEAAAGWLDFGNVPERAYTLLGQGRCLLHTDPAAAERPLRKARELFAAMGYRPALAEVEELLEAAGAPAREV